MGKMGKKQVLCILLGIILAVAGYLVEKRDRALEDGNRLNRYAYGEGMVADHYDRLKVTLLNRNEGMIDSMVVKFGDVWGLKKTTNPNFRDGVNPHIWSYGKEIGWYVYQPGKEDYKVLSEAIKTYLQVFQEPEETMQMGQKMC